MKQRKVSERSIRIGKILGVALAFYAVALAIVVGAVVRAPWAVVVISAIGAAIAGSIGIWLGGSYWKSKN